jgi:hypothetical protein
MSKYNQIINALNDGASFSWGFDGMSAPEPKGDLNAICSKEEPFKIGYHTQVFLSRAFVTEGLTITYLQDGEQIKIYY